MQGEKQLRWRELCEQAVTEQEPDRLLQLVREISTLLEEKYYRLTLKRNFSSPPSA